MPGFCECGNEPSAPHYLANFLNRPATIALVMFTKTPSVHTIGYTDYLLGFNFISDMFPSGHHQYI